MLKKTEIVGGKGTNDFSDVEAAEKAGCPITKIEIFSGDVLNALKATNGTVSMPKHGGADGGRVEISFQSDEYITGIEGNRGDYFGANHIVQLILITNLKRKYGPFGTAAYATNLKPFKLETSGKVYAFFGSSLRHTDNSEFISALGLASM